MKRVKEWSYVVRFFLEEDKFSGVVLNTYERMKSFSWETSKKSIAVIKAGQDKRSGEFFCSINRQVPSYGRNAAEIVVAGLSSRTNEILH